MPKSDAYSSSAVAANLPFAGGTIGSICMFVVPAYKEAVVRVHRPRLCFNDYMECAVCIIRNATEFCNRRIIAAIRCAVPLFRPSDGLLAPAVAPACLKGQPGITIFRLDLAIYSHTPSSYDSASLPWAPQSKLPSINVVRRKSAR